MSRTLSARIAAGFLVLHGLIELAGSALGNSSPQAMVSFGGLTGPLLEQNSWAVLLFGVLWGIARLIAAWGTWSMRKWAMSLGIILSTVTLVAAISIVPAGIADTLFAIPALIFLLHAWFGSETIEA